MSGFLRRPLVVCDVVCAAARSGLTRLGTPGSSPSLSFAPADANCVSVSLSMLPAAAMRSNVGAGVDLEFSLHRERTAGLPTSRLLAASLNLRVWSHTAAL
ncbi:hypothetical protein ZWY2020_027958 [Hordeum vulgare]|nr:hypothetical protein ZWY2020_027958 [Hordeum vulgare]